MAQKKDIESIYYLSPLQQGLLFHAVTASGDDPYLTQTAFVLRGQLDATMFERAWQMIVRRHAVLRTGFVWEGVARPVQVVRPETELPLTSRDWRGLDDSQREAAFRDFLAEDRRRGFDFAKSPLMRVALLRADEQCWYFVNTHHHLLLDGWSFAIVLREAFLTYHALELGTAVELAQARPYRDYVSWVERQSHSDAERFWRKKLAGFSAPTSLPGSGVEQTLATAEELRYAEQELCFSAEESREITAFARHMQVTQNSLIQAMWSLLLQRHAGEAEVVFGSTVSGRTPDLRGADGMVGLLINTQPVRVRVEPGACVRDWLSRLQDQSSELRQYEWTPLAEVQRWSDVPPGQALFESIVVFDSYPEEDVADAPDALEVKALSRPAPCEQGARLGHGRNNYPLSLIVEPGNELKLILCYERQRLTHADAARLLGQCRTLLASLRRNADRRLAELSVLCEHERALLSEWSRTSAAVEDDSCVHQLFERCVDARPDQVAIVCETRRLSYAELDSRANELAHRLLSLGVGRDECVGVCLERSPEMIVAIFGVLKAGAAYVPLDPKLPNERIESTLSDSKARVLLTTAELSGRLQGSASSVVALDSTEFGRTTGNGARPRVPLAAANLAYVIYTSGSTGRPKGVCVEHRQLVNYLRGVGEQLKLPERASFAFVSTVAADLGHTSLFGALCTGRTLNILTSERTFNPDAMGELLAADPVDVMKIVPSHLSALLEAANPERILPRRMLVLGGEASSWSLLQRVAELAPDCAVLNHYGPTETTVGALAGRVELQRRQSATVPIGRPLAGASCYILGADLDFVPVGAIGELYIGGAGVTRGYHERPALTAERFVPDPFAASPGGRLYETGDRARYLPDGSVEFLGRADHQVKIRGNRVELGEVEAAIRVESGVKDVVALARETGDTKQLVAYVVPGSASLDTDQLAATLSRRLPDYMVPSALVMLEKLPLTANGKVDRARLPEPEPRKADERSFVAPRGEVESILAEIWSEVLGVPRVSVHDNFFALGGDSIRSLQVVARANQRGFKLSPKHLFENPTVAGAALLAKPKAGKTAVPRERAETPPFALSGLSERELAAVLGDLSKVEDAYPLSPMQEGMLLHTRLNPGAGIYLMQQHYTWTGELRREWLLKAWQRVAERHSILRTSFAWQDLERPLQIVWREVDLSSVIDFIDVRDLPEEQREPHVRQRLERELVEGLDMTQAPLMRIHVVRSGEQAYRIVRSFHHILTDDWCFSLLLRECLSFYEAERDQKALTLPSARPYGDYIAWLGRQDLAAAERFWRGELRGFESATSLGVELATSEAGRGPSSVGDDFFELSEATTAELLKLAQEYELTPNTFIQGAWALLLSRYSGDRDVLFGVTVAGRPTDLAGVESIIGLFINSLPLRLDVTPNLPLIEWLKQLLARNYRIREFEYPPLVQIQQWSDLPSGQALFNSLVVFENAPQDARLSELVSDAAVSFEHDRVHTNYPLTVVGYPGERIGIRLSYDRRLFEPQAITRMLGHLRALLEGFIESSHARLAELALLDAAEEQKLLAEWGRSADNALSDKRYVERFEEQVSRTPDRIAVTGAGARFSYAALNHEANRVAAELCATGEGPDSIVAIADARGAGFLSGILGVLKAGGAYLPLDPEQPEARLAQILRVSRVATVLTSELWQAKVERAVSAAMSSARVIVRESIARLSQVPPPNASSNVGPGNLAYVIFTSGSTGEPKGAMVEHAGMLNNVWGKVPALGLTPDDVIGQTASQCFDISVWQFLSALLCGARVHIVADEVVASPEALLAETEEQGITVLELVPALINELVGPEVSRRPLSRLRWLLPTGEALAPEICRRWFDRYPGVPLMNAYGPAECADDVATHVLREAPAAERVPIGRPVPGVRLHVLAGDELAPLGAVGELCVGGVGVGRGYLQDPRRTAAAFVPDGFADVPGARLYRTGDLARWLEDGQLQFVGRRDHQVKIRGFRIELGEIEARLLEHEDVADAAVLAPHTAGSGARLVAYVAARGQREVQRESLRSFLQAKLPDYMVPATFVALPELPRNANGKVDRSALLAIGLGREDGGASSFNTPAEELVAGIWCSVLRLTSVSRDSNFFELGGHSLLATQVASRVRRVFGVEVPLRTFFERATLAELAAEIDALSVAPGRDVALVPVARSGWLPLSFAQQRLWFIAQLEGEGAAYNMTSAVIVSGALDLQVLEQSFAELVRRHESLRTTFGVVDGEPRQRVEPEGRIGFEIVDLSGSESESRRSELQKLAEQLAARPFDLTRDLLVRVAVVRLAEKEHALVLVVHHIVADGWSMNVLVSEVAELYDSLRGQRAPVLPALPVQYADFAVWQRTWLDERVRKAELEFWQKRLSGHPHVLELDTDRPRPAAPTYRGGRYTIDVDLELAEKLRALGRSEGATLFMTLLTAWSAVLSARTGVTDLLIGTDVAGRRREETEGLIGFFVNLLALRMDLSGAPTFREAVKRVREVTLEAYAHQDIPFEQVVDAVRPARQAGRHPLVQALFVLQNTPATEIVLDGVEFKPLDLDWEVSRFDLGVFVEELEQGLGATFRYPVELFEAKTVEDIASDFLAVLRAVADRPEDGLLSLVLAARKERALEAKKKRSLRNFVPRRPEPRAAVKTRTLGSQAMPLVFEPALAELDLAEWAKSERSTLETALLKHGAVLFRGFGLRTAADFERVAQSVCGELFGEYGDLPREGTGGSVYHSTPYPEDQSILFHNESSHLPRWPAKQWFFCFEAAREGGATPLADCRRVYDALPRAITEAFRERGLRYVRNFTPGLDVSWQDFFKSDQRLQVEAKCRAGGMAWEWLPGGGLRTIQCGPGVLRHPKSGELSFFNQVELHHPDYLDPAVRQSLLAMVGEARLPRNVAFGDGGVIDEATTAAIREAYARCAVRFPWQAGDLILLDNMLVAHARDPFVGPRKIFVAMGEMVDAATLREES
jgi:amino acid adenylation domain-containing protein